MKKLYAMIATLISLTTCNQNFDFDTVISTSWATCVDKDSCIIDLSTAMNFNWDTMHYYSGSNSLEEINAGLGFELKDFVDVGDRVIFLYNDKYVYQKVWHYNPEYPAEGTIFKAGCKKFTVSKKNAVFKITKIGEAYY